MSDVVLSPQTIALVGGLMTALVAAIGTLSGAIVLLYRQVLRERDRLLEDRDRLLNERNLRLDERNRLLEERDARLNGLWRDLETKEIRITALEVGNERLQRLATDATEGWKLAVMEQAQARVRPS